MRAALVGQAPGQRGQAALTARTSALGQDAFPLRTLRIMQYGASPIHPDTLRAAMARLPGAGFLGLYGQTEGSPITWLSPEDHRLAAGGGRNCSPR